jgi:hypothetical protein
MDIYSNGTMSESSKKVYLHNLSKLAGTKEIKTLNFLKDVKDIEEKIKSIKNPNTQRSYWIAVVSALKDRKGFTKQYKSYHDKMRDINIILGKEAFKTDKTKKKYTDLTQDTILKRKDDLIQEYNNTKDYKTLYNLVVVSLYTVLPPRRLKDYMVMKIGDGTDMNYNYYTGSRFIFNNYKTKGTYQSQVIDVPKELVKLLNYYIANKAFKDSPFLLHTARTPYVKLNTQMNKILQVAFDNTNIGCSILRSLFLTDKFGTTMKELRSDAENMGTSIDVMNSTYIPK